MKLQCDSLTSAQLGVRSSPVRAQGEHLEMTDAVKNGRSDEVDALRAIAMLAVLALHTHLLPMGWMGVWLFYVISGYVVTHSVIGRGDDGNSPLARLGTFLQRRATRILPVYYLYIGSGLVVALLVGLTQDGGSIASLVLFYDNITMVMGEGRINGWPTGHLWTLSVEMQFYALYGTALCLLPRRPVRRILVALLVLCPIARLIVGQTLTTQGWTPLDTAFAVYAGPGLHFDIFAMGALLAFARDARPGARLSRILLPAGTVAILFYSAAYVAINIMVRDERGIATVQNVISGILFGQLREVFLYTATGLFMTGVIASAVEGGRGWIAPLLHLPLFPWIGRISYGAYLFHPLGLKGAMFLLAIVGIHTRSGGTLVHIVQFAIALPLTLGAAWLSWRYFETPLRHLIDGDRKHGAIASADTRPQWRAS